MTGRRRLRDPKVDRQKTVGRARVASTRPPRPQRRVMMCCRPSREADSQRIGRQKHECALGRLRRRRPARSAGRRRSGSVDRGASLPPMLRSFVLLDYPEPSSVMGRRCRAAAGSSFIAPDPGHWEPESVSLFGVACDVADQQLGRGLYLAARLERPACGAPVRARSCSPRTASAPRAGRSGSGGSGPGSHAEAPPGARSPRARTGPCRSPPLGPSTAGQRRTVSTRDRTGG